MMPPSRQSLWRARQLYGDKSEVRFQIAARSITGRAQAVDYLVAASFVAFLTGHPQQPWELTNSALVLP
jgi:hypothetical protein